MSLKKALLAATVMPALLYLVPHAGAGQNVNGEYFTTSENPHEQFNITKLNANKIEVTFIATKNVRAVCEAESKKRGYGGFNKPVEACSFWDASSFNNKCTVVLPETTNFHTLGHEIRHCMQGSYHKQSRLTLK